jgi:hypothetical protein
MIAKVAKGLLQSVGLAAPAAKCGDLSTTASVTWMRFWGVTRTVERGWIKRAELSVTALTMEPFLTFSN